MKRRTQFALLYTLFYCPFDVQKATNISNKDERFEQIISYEIASGYFCHLYFAVCKSRYGLRLFESYTMFELLYERAFCCRIGLLITASKDENDKYTYNPTTVVILVELGKLLFILILQFRK